MVAIWLSACSSRHNEFDAESWKAWDGKDASRLRQVQSLMEEFKGESKARVQESIGTPDVVNPPGFVACQPYSETCEIWGFRIGSSGFLLVEPQGLFIVFRNGVAVEFMRTNFSSRVCEADECQ